MYKASIIITSDRAAAGIYNDETGPVIRELLCKAGYETDDITVIPDEQELIEKTLLENCKNGVQLIVTAGGTGFSPRDLTPEATKAIIEREAPGISEYMRQRSMELTPRGMLSRGVAGIRGNSLIINLPGSPKAAKENLGFILPHLEHGLDMLCGKKEE